MIYSPDGLAKEFMHAELAPYDCASPAYVIKKFLGWLMDEKQGEIEIVKTYTLTISHEKGEV